MSAFYTIVAVLMILSAADDTFDHVKALLLNIVVLQAVKVVNAVSHRVFSYVLSNVSLVWYGVAYVNSDTELPYGDALLFSAIRSDL
jgi:hypothetical protein